MAEIISNKDPSQVTPTVERTRQRRFRMTPKARDWEKANIVMNLPESLPLLKKLGEEFRKACEQFVPV